MDSNNHLEPEVQAEIWSIVPEILNPQIVYGVVGNSIDIPHAHSDGPITHEIIKFLPMKCNRDYEIGYCKAKNILFIKNLKRWN